MSRQRTPLNVYEAKQAEYLAANVWTSAHMYALAHCKTCKGTGEVWRSVREGDINRAEPFLCGCLRITLLHVGTKAYQTMRDKQCQDCLMLSDDVVTTNCPYASEIYAKTEVIRVCDKCYTERLMDI